MTQSVEGKTLETLMGTLAQTLPQLDRGTILHSDELTTERRTNPELRKMLFYTADSTVYTVEREKREGLLGKIRSFFRLDKEAIWYLGRGETNPIFNNIEEATQQLIRTGNYILRREKRGEIDAVITAEDTLKVKLSDLRLQGKGNVFRYFEIDTANYDSLNEHQRIVAERVYGSGEDFIENMKMLNEAGIGKIEIYVLNPSYVKQNVPQNGALARASMLYPFYGHSMFYAIGWGVDYYEGLRGVRKVAEGDAPKVEDPSEQAFQTLLRHPKPVVENMKLKATVGEVYVLRIYLN